MNTAKRVFNCRGSLDGHGDVINLVMHCTHCDAVTAVERITGQPRPDRTRDENAQERATRERAYQASAIDFTRQQEEARARIEARAAADEAKIAEVLRRAVPIDSAEAAHGWRYLTETRGLHPQHRLVGDIRFVAELDYWGVGDNGSDDLIKLATLPAIVAVIRDFSGDIIGLSQTYLDQNEPVKWTPIGSHRNSPKKVRGRKQGGMIWLGMLEETIAIAEGWENALAWHQLGLGPETVMLAAAVDLGNLAGRSLGSKQHRLLKNAEGQPVRIADAKRPDPKEPGIILPQGIKSIIIIADNDSESHATASRIGTAGVRWRAAGLQVSISWPPDMMDYNGLLLKERDG